MKAFSAGADVGRGDDTSPSGKSKEKADEADSDIVDEDDDDSIEDGMNVKGRSSKDPQRVKRQTLRARIRECRVIQHRIFFLLGDVHHMLGSEYGSTYEEDKAYGGAEALRKELLKGTLPFTFHGVARQ